MNLNLTEEQKELLKRIVEGYDSGRKGEFFFVRSHGGSGLILPGRTSEPVGAGILDFEQLAREDLISLRRVDRNTSAGQPKENGIEFAHQLFRDSQSPHGKWIWALKQPPGYTDKPMTIGIRSMAGAPVKPPRTVVEFNPALHLSDARPLKVFLCHASGDKATIRNLYQTLTEDHFQPWLDEIQILPGQNWEYEISQAVRASDIVLVCLSPRSVTKEGFVQKEIKQALDVSDEKPEGTIFVIPVKLEECDVPNRLRKLQWVNLFDGDGYEKLKSALTLRATGLGVFITEDVLDATDATILLVDDNQDLVLFLARLLRDSVRRVLMAGTVEVARRMFLEERPDTVVIDYMLPDGNGVELGVQFRNMSHEVIIVIMTGTILPRSEESLCEQHGFPLFRKPFLASDLRRAIKNRLSITSR